MAVESILAALGMRARADWMRDCLQELRREGNLPIEAQAQRCFALLLMADFNVCGAAVLPPDLHSMHKIELPGPFVLQIDEISDIGFSTRERYQERNAGVGNRCLKLSLTDGVQRVSAIEYRPIPSLKVLAPAGSKIGIRNVCVRRGLFLLVPEIVNVLGGSVEQLELARQRVVDQVNKPPRGLRNPRGTDPPRLAEQLTAAAWQPAVAPPDFQPVNGYQQTQRIQPSESHRTFATRAPEMDRSQQFDLTFAAPQSQASQHFEQFEAPRTRATPVPETDGCLSVRGQRYTVNEQSGSSTSFASFQQDRARELSSENISVSISEQATSVRATQFRKLSLTQQTLHSAFEKRQIPQPSARNNSSEALAALPFTYLALLQKQFLNSGAKQEGRVKCVLTGVKEFHFKNRDLFRLVVYIDDGSTISEALMDHQLVQTLVGHSPAEVTSALASTNSEQFLQMKNKMKEFQAFLTKFQGYMDIELSDVIKVLAIYESIQASDAWLLLTRVEGLFRAPERELH